MRMRSSKQHSVRCAHNAQVAEFTIVDAQGDIRVITRKSDPQLFRALHTSVGRLGVIVSLKMRIVRNEVVERSLTFLRPSQFLERMDEVQAQWRATGTLPDFTQDALWFWSVNVRDVCAPPIILRNKLMPHSIICRTYVE